ncbi:hypothetical protein EDB86DRAFT_2836403 [Lactarius hatsudake]|nr:hypothetical protein EDB86DRAFT_2836403 [Lactarius hatsudake]
MGQYKLVSKMHTLAPWANTSHSAEYRQEHHRPIQAHWQDAPIDAMGQYKLFSRIQLISRMYTLVPWANVHQQDAHIGAVGQYKHFGRMHDVHIGAMGQYKPFSRLLISRMHTLEPWGQYKLLTACRQEHCPFKLVGRMYTLMPWANTSLSAADASTMSPYTLISRMHTSAVWANTCFLSDHTHNQHGPLQSHWQGQDMHIVSPCKWFSQQLSY